MPGPNFFSLCKQNSRSCGTSGSLSKGEATEQPSLKCSIGSNPASTAGRRVCLPVALRVCIDSIDMEKYKTVSTEQKSCC